MCRHRRHGLALAEAAAALLLVTALFAVATVASAPPTALRLERALPRSGVSIERLKERDRARHGRLLSSSAKVSSPSGVVSFPVEGSADPFSVGLYYTRVGLGTPVKEFYVQIDTGSDILWVNCNNCNDCPTSSGLNIPIQSYNPSSSSTGSTVSCSDSKCTTAAQYGESSMCPSSDSSGTSSCGYTFQYGDGSTSSGYYVTDNLYLNHVTSNGQITNSSTSVVFGCSNSLSGDLTSTTRAVDGIFGFGKNPMSVISQLSSAGEAPNVFSHCFIGSDSGGGLLVLGEIEEPGIVYTPMVASQEHYNLNLESISVSGQKLAIDASVFATSATGTIIDSGTTLAYLTDQAFSTFVSSIVSDVSSSVSTTSTLVKGTQCFVTSSSIDSTFPTVTLNFSGGAVMTVKPEDYLLNQGSVGNRPLWCIGWQQNSGGPTILGDLVLKDKIVVYDLAGQRIGWADYDCSQSVNVSTSLSKSGSPGDSQSMKPELGSGSSSAACGAPFFGALQVVVLLVQAVVFSLLWH